MDPHEKNTRWRVFVIAGTHKVVVDHTKVLQCHSGSRGYIVNFDIFFRSIRGYIDIREAHWLRTKCENYNILYVDNTSNCPQPIYTIIL